jgi:hypothetical protein
MDRSLAEVKVRRGAQNALKYPHAGGKVQVRGNLGAVCFIIPRKTFAPPALRALTQLQKAGFRKIELLYFVEIPALEKPFWGLTF